MSEIDKLYLGEKKMTDKKIPRDSFLLAVSVALAMSQILVLYVLDSASSKDAFPNFAQTEQSTVYRVQS